MGSEFFEAWAYFFADEEALCVFGLLLAIALLVVGGSMLAAWWSNRKFERKYGRLI